MKINKLQLLLLLTYGDVGKTYIAKVLSRSSRTGLRMERAFFQCFSYNSSVTVLEEIANLISFSP